MTIFASKIPVISAVGHETDFTIADFVADLRAPTPSAAAELAVTDVFDLKNKLESYRNRYKMLLKRKTELMRMRYEKCMKSRAFTMPKQRINDNYVQIDKSIKSMVNSINLKMNGAKVIAGKTIAKLDTLSPLKTLTRGYCLTEKNGNIVKSVEQLKKDDAIALVFTDGRKQAKVM